MPPTCSKRIFIFQLLIALFVSVIAKGEGSENQKVRVLLTHGGHPFNQAPFFKMLDSLPGIEYTKAALPESAHLLKPGLEKEFDVILMYDMVKEVPAEHQESFLKLLEKGIGIVSLHHNLGAHRSWDLFPEVLGGKYLFKEGEVNGVKMRASKYSKDQRINVEVVDKDHPITRGIKSFKIEDETYKHTYTSEDVKVLLSTKHKESDEAIAWVTEYKKSPVFYFKLGDKPASWAHRNYPKIVGRAIHWANSKLSSSASADNQIDLVPLGKEVFHSLGCAECHTDIKNDLSVKTGPSLYGLFQKEARKRDIMDEKGQNRKAVSADYDYFMRSIRQAPKERAIAESGPLKGQTYLPIMPPYPKELLSDFQSKAIFHYLKTLNDPEQSGPAQVMSQDLREKVSQEIVEDPSEILVTDKTRIYRARLEGSSARAIYVGTPSGFNYSFDPRNLSIGRAWWGGFLNIKEELDGRAKKLSRLGNEAKEVAIEGSLLVPHHTETGELIDMSFKSPMVGDMEALKKYLYGKSDFSEQLASAGADFVGYTRPDSAGGNPTFHYTCGSNKISLRFSVATDGKAEISLSGVLETTQKFTLSSTVLPSATVSTGALDGNVWTLPASRVLTAKLTFSLDPVSQVWRPQVSNQLTGPQTSAPVAHKGVQLPAGYKAESISPPLDVHGRPQLFEPLGMDEAPDGSLIVTTRTAGIWRYKEEQWTQIAEGVLDSMGVIVEDQYTLVVGQKAELTRLIDKDKDGVMDVYQTISDDFHLTENYCDYMHGPVKGKDGNYYVNLNLGERYGENIYKAKGRWMGTQGSLRGWNLQITPEGKMTPYANGLRSPAGLATAPDGQIYYTDNQGEFVGTSKLFLLEEGAFYGHPSSLVDLPGGMTPDSPEIAWKKVKDTKVTSCILLPHARLSNSPGSPVWDTTDGAFGPFAGQMFLGDQTLSNLFRVIVKPEKTGMEGALIPFADKFPSGVMRLKFASDNALYVGQTGRGWRAKGGKEDALIKISRTTDPLSNQLLDVIRKGNNYRFVFSEPLDKAPAPKAIECKSWTYTDSHEYGSKETRVIKEKVALVKLDPGKKSFTVTLKSQSYPSKETARVYQFHSERFSINKGTPLKAYYSISQK